MSVSDPDTVALLQWAAPRLALRWDGFRNVRGTVRKRLARRIAALGLRDVAEYRVRLDADPSEWDVLARMCRIPISRFYRDRAVFDRLRDVVLPAIASRGSARIWSAGCACGQEPYTVAILWHLVIGRDDLDLVATDIEPEMIARAERGAYDGGTLRELPEDLRSRAFTRDGDLFCVRPEIRRGVTFRCEDMRVTMPDGPFDLVLCRNSAFTYLDAATQRTVAAGMRARLAPGGEIVVGAHEGAQFTSAVTLS